ncbi:MAG: DUF87 domain-containing protein [Bacteroidia bacterium]|nr:DUF87 domain-containing protein [Bacteroidia bacterium]
MSAGTNDTLSALAQGEERIGVIGSPSSTSALTVDILSTAVQNKLVGELAVFQYTQEGALHYALGQITEVQLRNVWQESPTMRSLIRQKGPIQLVSEKQDVHIAQIGVSAVFKEEGGEVRESYLATVPPTGTYVHRVQNTFLQRLLTKYQQEIFYLGWVYGSKDLLLPMWFKHFDSGPGGAGEAYHIGIFGKTGSGKSVLAKMLLAAYSRHPQMGAIIFDPQGEFSRDLKEGSSGGFPLPLREILAAQGRKVEVYGIDNLILDRWALFKEILILSDALSLLGIRHKDNQGYAADAIEDICHSRKVKLDELVKEDSPNVILEQLQQEGYLKRIYAEKSRQERVTEQLQQPQTRASFLQHWHSIAQLFSSEGRKGARKIDDLLSEYFRAYKKPFLVIGLHKSAKNTGEYSILSKQISDKLQFLIIDRFLEALIDTAERGYHNQKSLNTLVVIDEAHRLAPRELPREYEEAQRVRMRLVDAVRTTRKYGLGWLFISQTLSSLEREIIEQLRIAFFGFGLGMGAELRTLQELVGGQNHAIRLYQSFRDPHSTLDPKYREYPFMTIGPVSPLSFSGSPLFFSALNDAEKFLKVNSLRVAASEKKAPTLF